MALAVLAGQIAPGTVRSGTLELLERKGKIRLGDLRIINTQINDQLPPIALHPPLPLVAHGPAGPSELSEKVPLALLSMLVDNPACRTAGHAD
ncbi:hypothetical protein DFAR_3770003 [Desulfarculales bacterium]